VHYSACANQEFLNSKPGASHSGHLFLFYPLTFVAFAIIFILVGLYIARISVSAYTAQILLNRMEVERVYLNL
jgi:glycerol-3-phosphate acyltransferase PlsY